MGEYTALPYGVNHEDWPQAKRSRKASESEYVVTWCRNVLWHHARHGDDIREWFVPGPGRVEEEGNEGVVGPGSGPG